MIPCYFCQLGFTTWDFLAQHLIDAHLDEEVLGWSLRNGWRWGRPVAVHDAVCWCKFRCTDDYLLGRHLEIHGGLEQHLLEIGLGLANIEEQPK